MPDRAGRRLAVSLAGVALAAGLLTACGDDDNGAAAPSSSAGVGSTSTTAPSGSTTTSSAAPSKPAESSEPTQETSKPVTEQPVTSPTDLPDQTDPETVPAPAGGARGKFLDKVHKADVTVDDEYALSLGTSVCDVRKRNGQKTAEQYAAAALKAANNGKEQPAAGVRDFVAASAVLC
ncbi:DUF732 domain-containing protein [Gordonia sp. VNK21]|uniref:DUF732 domain-containing protein n=1 Tax=Gordonia sp. VNK21 TaxID=3382483 RepID=UPI0038D4520B